MLSKTPSIHPFPAGASRLSPIDGLRALAMLMVFSFHNWQFSGSPILTARFGHHAISFGALLNTFPAGVDLFMVLSGFCLFWPIAQRGEAASDWSAKTFALRRIRRIVPPYYAAIVYVTLLPVFLVVLYRLLGQPAKWQVPASGWNYLTHLLFIHTLFPTTWDGIQGVFWSLGLEAQFYLAFPLVILGFRRFGIRVVWIISAASILYRIGAAYYTRDSSWNIQFLCSIFFIGRWMQFATGMLAAWIVAKGLPSRWTGRIAGGAMSLAAIALYAASQCQSPGLFPFRDVVLAVSFGVGAVSLCSTQSPFRSLVSNPIASGLGLISYSVFLIHQNTSFYLAQLIKKVLHLDGPVCFGLLLTAGLAFILALSAVFFRLFERPFISPRPSRPQPPVQDLPCLSDTLQAISI